MPTYTLHLGIFYMPQICNMGPAALLPLQRKACWGFFRPEKSWRLRPGLNPRTWVLKGSTLPLDHQSCANTIYYKVLKICISPQYKHLLATFPRITMTHSYRHLSAKIGRDIHLKCKTFIWKVLVISLYCKFFLAVLIGNIVLMTPCIHICHYFIPSLETSLKMVT
jgi:hypothetical protein